VGQGATQAAPCDGRADYRMGGCVWAGGPAGHASGGGAGVARRAQGQRTGALDPRAPMVDRPGRRPSRGQSSVDCQRVGGAVPRPSGGRGLGHDAPGEVGGVVGGDCRRGPHAAAWLGGDALAVAQRPVSAHDPHADPAVASRVSGWRALVSGGGPRVSERGPLCPAMAGRAGLQRARALERLGDGERGICQGVCPFGCGATAARAADGRHDRAGATGPARGARVGRSERHCGDPAPAETQPGHAARAGPTAPQRTFSTGLTSRDARPSPPVRRRNGMPTRGYCSPPPRRCGRP
jgi:hypothetical protein